MNKKIILLTGIETTNKKSSKLIEARGDSAISLPMQEIHFLSKQPLNESYVWVIFTSGNAVDAFYAFYPELLSTLKKAVVGPSTQENLQNKGFAIDLIPQNNFSAVGIVKSFEKVTPVNILYPCSILADDFIEINLTAQGHRVTRLDLYEPLPCASVNLPNFTDIIFFSSSGAKTFAKSFDKENLKNKKVVAIGKKTATTIKELFGISALIPEKQTAEGAILELYK